MAVTTTYSWQLIDNIDLSLGEASKEPDVTGLANGGIAVSVTHDGHTDLDIFNANGSDAGDASLITGRRSAIDQLANGNLAVVSQDADSILFTVKNSTGGAVVPSTDLGDVDSSDADVAALTGGRFVITATDELGTTGGDSNVDVYIRNSDGAAVTSFEVSSSPDRDTHARVAALDNGNFAVTWQRVNGSSTEVWRAVYNSAGGVVAAAALVDNSGTVNSRPDISATNDGFAIVYQDNGEGSGTTDITIARYNSAGALLGYTNASNPTLTNDRSDEASPTITRLSNGMLAVGWEDNAFADADTIVALFDPAGVTRLASRTVTGGERILDDVGDIALAGFGSGQLAAFQTNFTTDDVNGEALQARRTSTGDEANDVIIGDDLLDIADSGGGNDTVITNSSIGRNSWNGGAGFDTIDWSGSSDVGASFDLLAGTATNAAATATEQMINFENLIGTANRDFIFGTNGGNVLEGLAGNDTIDGRGGLDRADFSFAGAPSNYGVVWASGGASNFQFRTGIHGTDTLRNIEVVFLKDTVGTGDIALNSSTITQYFAPTKLGINSFGSDGAAGGWTNNNLYHRDVGDVNGDNRADIIGFGASSTFVSLGRGDGTFANPVIGINSFGSSTAAGGWSNNNLFTREIGDVNGDGRDDIIGFGSDVTYVSLGQVNGTFANPIVGINAFGVSAAGGGWTNNNIYPREVADVNGDGRADIVGFGSENVMVSLGQVNGTFAAPFVALANKFGASAAAGGWISQDLFPRELGDVNGDGRADIVGFGPGQVYVSLAQANGTFAEAVGVGPVFSGNNGWPNGTVAPRELADLNNDGRADIVGFGPGGTYGALALPGGLGFSAAALMFNGFGANADAGGWTSNDLFPRVMADLDADNRADIIGFGGAGAFTAINTTDYFVI